jgi:hypothetical protein
MVPGAVLAGALIPVTPLTWVLETPSSNQRLTFRSAFTRHATSLRAVAVEFPHRTEHKSYAYLISRRSEYLARKRHLEPALGIQGFVEIRH